MKTMKQQKSLTKRSQSKVRRDLMGNSSIEKTNGVMTNPVQDCSLRAEYNVCENM